MSVDNASAVPSRLKRSRVSSLRYASVVMAILPVTLGCLLALGTLLLGPSAEAVAGVAAILFGINALIMPRLLDWRIGARLTALIDTLRAARDGQFERVPHMNDNDAIGDIARLAYDLVAMQANSGRFALGLHRAKEFAQASDDMIDRLADGAQEVDRMLAVFEASTKTLSRVSERFVGNLNAVTTGADRNVQDLVDAASRAVRSAEAMASAAGKGGAPIGHSAAVETPGGRTLAQAIDPVLGKLEDLGQAIAGLPKAAELRRICAGATAPVLEKLSELPGQTKASLASLEAPIIEARRALEAKLDTMDGRIASSRRDVDAASVKTLSEITLLSDAVARVEARVSGAAGKLAPLAVQSLDISPVMERLATLERPLALLLERPAAHAETVDLEPVKAGLVDIAARLATIGADAAKAARTLPSFDLAPVMASLAQLQRPLAMLVERPPVSSVAADLQPLMTGLADLASRLSRMEANALRAARSAPSIDTGPILEGIARLERPLASLVERAPSEAVNIQPVVTGLADLAARLAAIEAQAAEVAASTATAVDMTPILESVARLERPLAQLIERPLPASEPVDLQPVLAGIADLAARLAMVGDTAEAAMAAATDVSAVDMAPVLQSIARLERPLALLTERSEATSQPVDLNAVMAGLADLAAKLASTEAHAAHAAKVAAIAAAAVDMTPILQSMDRLQRPLALLTERPLAAAAPVDLAPVLQGLADLTSRLSIVGADAAQAAENAARTAAIAAPAVDMAPVLEGIARLERPLALLNERSPAPSEPVDLAPVMAGLADLAAKLASTEAHAVQAAKIAATAAAAIDMRPILQSMDRLERPLALLTERPRASSEPVDLGPVLQGLADVTARLTAIGADAAHAAQAAANPAPVVDIGPIIESIARLERPLAQLTERPQAVSEPVDLAPVLHGLADLTARLTAIGADAAHAAQAAAKPAPVVDIEPIIESIARLERPLAQLTERPQAVSEPVDLAPVLHGLADLTARLKAIGADAAHAAQAVANPAPAIDIGPIIESIARLERPLALLIERSLVTPDAVDLQPVLQGLAELTSRVMTTETHAEQAAKAAAAVAPPVDSGPIVESLARLEQSLGLVLERSTAPTDAVDLEPVTAGLTDIGSRLAAIEAHAASAPAAPHPDAGLLVEFDAARAPLQRLLVAFRLALRDIAQESDRLRVAVDGLARPDAPAAAPLDLSPIVARLDDVVARLDSVEALTQEQLRNRPVASDPGQLAEFDAAKVPMQRILVGLRLALREISEDAARFREAVQLIGSPTAPEATGAAAPSIDLSPIAEQLDDIINRLSSLEVATQEAVRSRPAPPDPSLLAEFDAAKAPMQRILTGLRLALRDISDGATEFRETVKQLGSQPAAEPVAAAVPTIDLSPIAERLDELAQRFSSIETALQEPARAPATTANAMQNQILENQILPQLVIDRSAMSTALTGLKLMMREIANEATALRSAADTLPTRLEITAPSVDLSQITEPLATMREELAAGHGVLAEIHAQIGRDRLLAKPLPATMAESGTPSLTTTLSLMSAFSSAVEIRFNDIEERIADVAQNYQSDDGRDAGDELATRLLEAASEMRREVDQFLAVGAALSGEIEAAAKDRKIQSRNAHEPRSAMRLS